MKLLPKTITSMAIAGMALALAPLGQLPTAQQQGQLLLAPDQRRQALHPPRLEAALGPARAEHPPDAHRLGKAMDPEHRAEDAALEGRREHDSGGDEVAIRPRRRVLQELSGALPIFRRDRQETPRIVTFGLARKTSSSSRFR